METHISWVLLTGEWAYKFKKPLRFDFLDYSTLGRRRHFCELEVEINRVWAPQIYDGVVAIVRDRGELRSVPLAGARRSGQEVLEYAVRMRQFPQSALLSAQLKSGVISLPLIERLGEELARLHQSLAPATITEEIAYRNSVDPARENFGYLCARLPEGSSREKVAQLRAWTEQQIGELGEAFRTRCRAGHVRKCHGDLHLNNLLYWDDRFIPFDGIEFNSTLSQIDTINEIAFLLMELREQGYVRHAHRLRNCYFEATEDYEGLRLLRYYLVYRGMVRAKIDCIREQQTHEDAPAGFSAEGLRYLEFAGSTASAARPPSARRDEAANDQAVRLAGAVPQQLAITFGLSGSGKSTRALKWVDDAGFLRLRSDVIRKRLAGLEPLAKTPREDLPQLYGPSSTAATYAALAARADQILRAGYSVVADATFLLQRQREPFAELARRMKVDYRIIACEAANDELERRLRLRGADPSDATTDVLHRQIEVLEPLNAAEQMYVVTADRPSTDAR